MPAAKTGDTVRVHYTGRLEDGEVFDSSAGTEPLEFTIGQGNIIPGFEQAVVGMNPGESKTQHIEADNAYGPHIDEMVQTIDRSSVPPEIELEIGQQLQVRQPGGPPMILTVANLTESDVTLDGNHPLAGHDLTFDIQLVDIVAEVPAV